MQESVSFIIMTIKQGGFCYTEVAVSNGADGL